MDGRLSPAASLLRAPYGANNNSSQELSRSVTCHPRLMRVYSLWTFGLRVFTVSYFIHCIYCVFPCHTMYKMLYTAYDAHFHASYRGVYQMHHTLHMMRISVMCIKSHTVCIVGISMPPACLLTVDMPPLTRYPNLTSTIASIYLISPSLLILS